jgi:hypothetical protein
MDISLIFLRNDDPTRIESPDEGRKISHSLATKKSEESFYFTISGANLISFWFWLET